jgi:hypothetical protein
MYVWNGYILMSAADLQQKERIDMYGSLKFLVLVFKTFRDLLSVDRNALASVPTPTKYLAMIMLSCFWALAFGLYVGEVYFIGYSMMGHLALVTIAFVTWWTFKRLRQTYFKPMTLMRHEFELLRDPARFPKCYEMTDAEREQAVARLNLGYDPKL